MAGATTPDNIPYMTTGDGVVDTGYTEGLANAIQDAFDSRQLLGFKWADASARAAQTGMTAGDSGYQQDTGGRYYYNGSAWIKTSPAASRGPSSQTDYTSETIVASVTIDVVTGVLYKVTGSIAGSKITNTGTVRSRLRLGTASGTELDGNSRPIPDTSYAASVGVLGSATAFYTATSSGSVTFVLTAFASTSAYRVSANNGYISVEAMI